MGWLQYNICKSPKEELDSFWTYENEKITQRLLYSCTKNFTEYYAAVERINKETNQREVIAVVCLYHYNPRTYDNFAYKDMDESCGPYYYNAPKKLLNLLTPTKYAAAQQWRDNCWKVINRNDKLTKLKVGDKISFVSLNDYNNGIRQGDKVILDVIKNYRGRKQFRYGCWRWNKNQVPTDFEIIKKEVK